MIKLIQNNVTVAYLKVSDIRVIQNNDAEFTLQFTTACKKLKTEYLMQSTTEIEVDGNRFTLNRCEVVKTRGEVTTFSIQANHKSYKLIQKLHDSYSVSGTVQEHMNRVLSGTEFSFLGTDITDTLDLTVQLTNSRYMLHRLSRELDANVVYDGNRIGLYRAVGDDLALTLTVDSKLQSIARSQDFGTNKVTYRVTVDTLNMQEFETIKINDTLRVVDTELGLDDRRKVVKTEYSPLLKKNLVIEIGDIIEDTLCDDIIDLTEENIEAQENVITEVIHQQVINVETAHILNAWIKNLFVEYVETNMDSRLDRTTVERHFIRIVDEKEEMVYQELDVNQVEDLLIPDPRNSEQNINVYFTAVGNHPDAYRYFTITHPQSIHKDLSAADVEAFKVKVKMITNEVVLYSKEFKTIFLENGAEVTTPVETWGQGTGGGRGVYKSWKDQVGQYFIQYNQNNGGFTGFRLNGVKERMEWWDGKTLSWKAFIQAYGEGLNVAQVGNVVIHPQGTTIDTAQPTGLPCTHVVHNGTVLKEWPHSKLMQHASILGHEVVTTLAPIVRLIAVNVSVTAFDGASCEGLVVNITGDKPHSKTTDSQGKCTIQIDDGNYQVTISGFDGSKYVTTTQRIALGGQTPLNMAFMLDNAAQQGRTYLYRNGDENTPLTGGWGILLNEGSVIKQSAYMDAKIHNSSVNGEQTVFGCSKFIDFTPYTKLCYTIERVSSPDGTNAATPRITSNLPYGNWSPWATNITHDMLTNKTTFEVDLSNINGQYFFSFIGEWGAATGFNTLRVHEVWVEEKAKTYLYADGKESVPFSFYDRTPILERGTGQKLSSEVYMKSASDQWIQFATVEKIDVTNYQKICFDVTVTKEAHIYNWIRVGLASVLSNGNPEPVVDIYQITLNNDRKVYTLDITNTNGMYYVQTLVNGYTAFGCELKIHNIWLE